MRVNSIEEAELKFDKLDCIKGFSKKAKFEDYYNYYRSNNIYRDVERLLRNNINKSFPLTYTYAKKKLRYKDRSQRKYKHLSLDGVFFYYLRSFKQNTNISQIEWKYRYGYSLTYYLDNNIIRLVPKKSEKKFWHSSKYISSVNEKNEFVLVPAWQFEKRKENRKKYIQALQNDIKSQDKSLRDYKVLTDEKFRELLKNHNKNKNNVNDNRGRVFISFKI
jgi:hypothetical protein